MSAGDPMPPTKEKQTSLAVPEADLQDALSDAERVCIEGFRPRGGWPESLAAPPATRPPGWRFSGHRAGTKHKPGSGVRPSGSRLDPGRPMTRCYVGVGLALPGLPRRRTGIPNIAAGAPGGLGLPARDTDVPTIGVLIDHSGSIARPAWRDAALLALEHTNAGLQRVPAWKGVRFSLRFADSANSPALAVERARELVREGAKALVADTSDVAVALNSTHYDGDPGNDLAVPIICMGCTSPQLNNPFVGDPDPARQGALRDRDRWLWRTSAHSGPEAVALLRAARALGTAGRHQRRRPLEGGRLRQRQRVRQQLLQGACRTRATATSRSTAIPTP